MSICKQTRSPDKFSELSQAVHVWQGLFFSGLRSLSLNLSRLDACRLLALPSPRIQGKDFQGLKFESSWSYEMSWKLRLGRGLGRVAPWQLPSQSQFSSIFQMQNDFQRVSLWIGCASGKGKHLHRKSWNCQTDNTSEQRGPASAASYLSASYPGLGNLLEKSTIHGDWSMENTKYLQVAWSSLYSI